MGSFASIAKHFEEEYRFEQHYRNRPPIKPLESLQHIHYGARMNFHTDIRKNSITSSITSSISSSTLRHSSSRMSKYFLEVNNNNTSNTQEKEPTSPPSLRKSSKPDRLRKLLEETSDLSQHSLQKRNSLPCMNPHCKDEESSTTVEKSLPKSYSMREYSQRGKKPRFGETVPDVVERTVGITSNNQESVLRKM